MRGTTHKWLELTRQAKGDREAFVANLKQDVADMQTNFRDERLAKRSAAQQTRQDFVETVRDDVAYDLSEFKSQFAATHQLEAGNRRTFLQDLRDKTQALLEQARADLSTQGELTRAQRIAFLARLRDSLAQDLDDFHDQLMAESQAARDTRQQYLESLAAQTHTLLENARAKLLEQHNDGQATRRALSSNLREDVARDLSVFRQQFAESTARARHERQDYLAAQLQAGRVERARYHKKYRRNPQQASPNQDTTPTNLVPQPNTESTSEAVTAKPAERLSAASSSTSSSTSSRTSTRSTPSRASQKPASQKLVRSPAAVSPLEKSSAGKNPFDEIANAVLALVEQTPGSSLTALTSKLEGVGRGTVDKHLQALMDAGRVKARNRGYYLAVTRQDFDDPELDNSETDNVINTDS
jgi:hypothetical protein